jgi:hypothetical protein
VTRRQLHGYAAEENDEQRDRGSYEAAAEQVDPLTKRTHSDEDRPPP